MNRLACQFYSDCEELKISEANEHFGCKNYISDYNSGFSFHSYTKGDKVKISISEENAVFFIKRGQLLINQNISKSVVFVAGQMFLRTKEKENIEITALDDLSIVVMQFNNILSKCEKMSIDKIVTYCPAENIELEALDINESMNLFISSIIHYLSYEAYCQYMHDLKKNEFFFILRAFYEKEKIARFLSPVIHNQNNFISQVLSKYTLDCNVIELADRCSMSPKTLTRKFKEHFNQTPYQWIIQQKNKNILNSLAQSNVNIQYLSDEFGFSSSAHFVSYCKRYLKQTPLTIHKELNKK